MEYDQVNLKCYLKKHINDAYLEHHIPFILEHFTFQELKKNSFFSQEGKICNAFCYIEFGILQHSISTKKDEKTTYLALKDSCTSALKSFKNKTPSKKNIKAISNSGLWVINFTDFSFLLKNNSAFKTFYYNLVEYQIFLIDDYRIDLLTLSPEERYKKMLKKESKLLQQIPLSYLATFLGISTRSMSRIRKLSN
jgi:hypothetical protein